MYTDYIHTHRPVTEDFPTVSAVVFAFGEGKLNTALHTLVHCLVPQPVLHYSTCTQCLFH